jgi:hypothetical protein
MEVKIPARIRLSPLVVKFGMVWPELADFVKIGPKFKKKTIADLNACRSKAKSCSDIKTCYRQKVFIQTTVILFVPSGVCIFTLTWRECKFE